jgi:cytochrome c
MGSLRLLLALIFLGVCCQIGRPQSTYDLGTPPTAEELRAADISISPTGEGLPPGSGNATQGAQVYAKKCAVCHGDNGSGTVGPKLVKGAQPKSPVPCLSPCITDNNVIAIHAPYATVIWDYINRGMPFSQEGSLKPDEVYALTAFLLYKNDVIPEDKVLDAQSLPLIQMPNRNGYAIPDWKDGQMRPLYRSTMVPKGLSKGMVVGGSPKEKR